MKQSQRTALLNLYRIGVGLVGIVALIVLSREVPWSQASIPLAIFVLLSLIIKRAGFHIAPGVTHSLVGIIDVAALLLFGPVAGGIVATTSCLIYLLLRTLRHQTVATRNEMLQVALFSAGLKALTALGSGVITSETGVSDGTRSAATTRSARSRSVTIPTGCCVSSSTTRLPTLASRIRAAATWTVSARSAR